MDYMKIVEIAYAVVVGVGVLGASIGTLVKTLKLNSKIDKVQMPIIGALEEAQEKASWIGQISTETADALENIIMALDNDPTNNPSFDDMKESIVDVIDLFRTPDDRDSVIAANTLKKSTYKLKPIGNMK